MRVGPSPACSLLCNQALTEWQQQGLVPKAQDAQAAGLVAVKRPHFCAPPATRSSLSCQPPMMAS